LAIVIVLVVKQIVPVNGVISIATDQNIPAIITPENVVTCSTIQ